MDEVVVFIKSLCIFTRPLFNELVWDVNMEIFDELRRGMYYDDAVNKNRRLDKLTA